jgi:thiamine kinase
MHMLSQLDQALARWVPGNGDLRATALSGGRVNVSYLIERDGRRYSLRLAGADSQYLGVDRVWECAVRRAAGAAKLAPRVLRCEPQTGLILSEWAGGRIWTNEDARDGGQIARLTALLRRVHGLDIPAAPREMTPASWCEYYERQLRAVPISAWTTHARQLIERHARLPVLRTLCHSDLHHLNVIDDGGLQLLDWEYAHLGDPYWDLAAWIGNHDLDSHGAERLLGDYLGHCATAADGERLQCLTWLFDYVCWLWCAVAAERRHEGTAVARELLRRREVLAGRLDG